MSSFKELGINDFLIEKLNSIGIKNPTKIQSEAIPKILNDSGVCKDVFACSETGTGKSITYILPILNSLILDPRPYFALIITPTRELSYQVNEVIKILTKSKNTNLVKSILIIGGNKFDDDNDDGLWEGKPNIVVATPGRLLYCLEKRNYLDVCGEMNTLKFDMLVLDEADQLITPSFAKQLKKIIEWIDSNKGNRKRQTLVFSATLTPALESLKEYLFNKNSNKPIIINLLNSIENIKKELSTNPFLDQRFILCPEHIKTVYLIECLLDIKFKQLIIFCDSKKVAKLIYKVILALGFSGSEFKLNPVLLNSDLKQKLRFTALEKFKSLKSRILVTTDLASRGLDLPLVDLVINYDCPREEVTYIHRVGRTCRRPEIFKNRDDYNLDNVVSLSKNDSKYQGKSITFVSQHDVKLLKNIETSIQIKLNKEESLDEDNINKILRKVILAIKEAELEIEQEELEKNQIINPFKKIKT